MKLNCAYCGQEFEARHSEHQFCSKSCWGKHYRKTGAPKPRARVSIKQVEQPFEGYDISELLYRPTEQIIEALNVSQLAEAWGVDKRTAAEMAVTPWSLVDTDSEMTEERLQQVREWLRRQVDNRVVK